MYSYRFSLVCGCKRYIFHFFGCQLVNCVFLQMCSFLLQFQCCRHNIFHIPLLQEILMFFRVHSKFPFFKRPFLDVALFKVCIESVTVLSFIFPPASVSWSWGTWHLSSPTRDRTHTSILGKVLTTEGHQEFPISYFLSLIYPSLISLINIIRFSPCCCSSDCSVPN